MSEQDRCGGLNWAKAALRDIVAGTLASGDGIVVRNHMGTHRSIEAGPLREILDAADRPALVWSSEPPKVPGWYWVTAEPGAKHVPIVEHVYSVEYGASLKLDAPNALFAGPIPEPVEPEGGE